MTTRDNDPTTVADATSQPPRAARRKLLRGRKLLQAIYGAGVATSLLALIWENVVAAGGQQALDWDKWRWGISVVLALGKSLVWPLYWLARALGIDAG